MPKTSGQDDFEIWRDSIESFEIDGAKLYLPLGDTPLGEDELREMWARSRETGTSLAPGPVESDATDVDDYAEEE